MSEPNSREFELDEELLASHGQRFINYLIDYICQVAVMFGVFVVIIMVSISASLKYFFTSEMAATELVWLLRAVQQALLKILSGKN